MEGRHSNSPTMSRPARSRPAGRRLLEVGPWVLMIVTLLAFCGEYHWIFDLAAHFRWYYWMISVAWAIVLWKQVRSWSMSCLCLVCICNGCLVLPYFVPQSQPTIPADSHAISFISLNVFTGNPNKARVISYLRQRHSDVVLVMEVNEAWEQALQQLDDLYPYRLIHPRPDNFGIGILSQRPWIDAKLIKSSKSQLPSIVARIRHAGREFQFIGTHPLPPLGSHATHLRNDQLREIAENVSNSSLPSVVAGDFNASPWSFACRDFLHRSRLKDTLPGRGLQGSWNARSSIFRIPIDHFYVPQSAAVIRRALGPDVGSDHFPVELSVAFP